MRRGTKMMMGVTIALITAASLHFTVGHHLRERGLGLYSSYGYGFQGYGPRGYTPYKYGHCQNNRSESDRPGKKSPSNPQPSQNSL